MVPVRPQFEFKLPPPKQTQEELFESLIVYCWYQPWIAYGWYTEDARSRFSALEVNGGVWLIGRFHCFS
jgi:hypothetical protein